MNAQATQLQRVGHSPEVGGANAPSAPTASNTRAARAVSIGALVFSARSDADELRSASSPSSYRSRGAKRKRFTAASPNVNANRASLISSETPRDRRLLQTESRRGLYPPILKCVVALVLGVGDGGAALVGERCDASL